MFEEIVVMVLSYPEAKEALLKVDPALIKMEEVILSAMM